MKTHSVSLQNATVYFGNERVLNRVNLVVPHGESLGLIGPSGSGKTVLLKTVSGLLPLREGSAHVLGVELGKLSIKERKPIARKIAMTFQRSGLFDSLTAYENLLFPLQELSGDTKKVMHERILQSLSDVGLEGQGELYPHEMSGGMQKRLGIARALSLQPEIVLYDDPTAGLDPVTSRQIVELILRMKEKYQMTLLIVSSELNVAYALSDSIAFLYRGEVLEQASNESFRRSANPYVAQFVHGRLEGPLNKEDSI